MPEMTFAVDTRADSATANHQAATAAFSSTEHRMGGPDEVPNPLELLLGSLTGCMNVVLQMVAHEKGFPGVSARFRATGTLDPRGFMGDPSVPPYFHTVSVDASVEGIPVEARDEVRAAVGSRCPVHRLFEAAQVSVQETWDWR